MMHDAGKSDRPVVPTKHPNKATTVAAEDVEGRGLAKGNTDEQNAARTLRREVAAPSALARVRERARRDTKARFTALLHHVTVDRLRTAFEQLKKRPPQASMALRGRSTASTSRRSFMSCTHDCTGEHTGRSPLAGCTSPRPTGGSGRSASPRWRTRFVQRAVVEVMNAIYEQDFLGFSYGFRPGRGQHDALDALAAAIVGKKVNWVLDADIRGFFDAIDHGWLVKFVEHRIGDRRLVRLIQKWLTAGVMEDGRWTASTVGSPQGATASPLLANIYLHYVLDLWVQQWRRRHARGDVVIVRFSDDFIVGFEHEEEARRFLDELRERLRSLRWSCTPTRRVSLSSAAFALAKRTARGERGAPETFRFLGLLHICGRSRTAGSC